MLRHLFLPAALTAAVGGPIVYSQANKTDWSSWTKEISWPDFGESPSEEDAADPLLRQVLGDAAAATANEKEAGDTTAPESSPQAPPIDLAEALHFGVTPNWVMAHWPRLSARLGTLQLQGYRVPYYSGPRRDDVAGALTYYFDENQLLRRITFLGRTGDASKIIAVCEGLHGLQRRPTTQPMLTLYQAIENGRPRGQLWIRPSQIVQGASAEKTFEVKLTVDRPAAPRQDSLLPF